ncbi:MAG: tetratricopeptide repeat protein [Okeania sp. SIO2C2]|uniref:protein kinase family protein n=1 Tax=Okeania sp. SIO2C2 TaxID=2607787 RepID=UPI0013B8FF3F|nr:tetratricopeptide repeat protein [Okeania sp. SIO2C2]NEP89684.1 tetratricopeptide repeat protein [Okeania sp. SIO2C2]
MIIDQIVDKRYRLIKPINSSILGQTYLATDTHRPKSPQCLVREIRLSNFKKENREVILSLFQEKAEKIYRLSQHNGLLNLLAYSEENNNIYLVEDYIVGLSLNQELAIVKFLPEVEVIKILKDVLEILAFIHGHGETHGKITPANLIRRELDGKLVLINFWLERKITIILEENEGLLISKNGSQNNSDSLLYIPLEESQKELDKNSDIYALGIIAIQALTGLSTQDLLKQKQTNKTLGLEIPWQNLQVCSLSLSNIIDKMVNSQGKQHYDSASEALTELKNIVIFTKKNILSKLETIITVPQEIDTPTPPPQLSNNTKIRLIAGLIVITIAGVAIAYFWHWQFIFKAQALYKQSRELAKQGDQQAAIANYTQALQLNPQNAAIYYQRGNSYYSQRAYEKAIKDYTAAITIKENYHTYYQRALTYYELGDNEKAITDLTQTLRIYPKYTQAYQKRGRIYDKIGDYKNAIQDYSQSIKLNPQHSDAYLHRGIARAAIGDQAGAISDYTQTIKLNPSNAQAYESRGIAQFEIADYQSAITDYDRVLELKPDYSDTYTKRCSAYLKLANYRAAIKDCHQAIEINSQDSLAYHNQCIAYLNLGEYQKAAENCSITIDMNPENAEAYKNRGRVRSASGDLSGAIEDLTTTIKINPDNSFAYSDRGIIFLDIGNYHQAIEDFDQAIKINPSNAIAYYNRGIILSELQEIQAAIADLRQSANLFLEQGRTKNYQNSQNMLEKLLQ